MSLFFKSIFIFILTGISLLGAERQFSVISPYGGQTLRALGYLNDAGEFQKLKWSQQRRSPLYEAPRTRDITLVKPEVNEDGQTIYRPVLELPWPGDTDLALFAVVLIDGIPEPKVFALDDRHETFPENTLRVLNGLNQTIYALAGELKFQLEPAGLSRGFDTTDYQFVDKVLEEEEEAEPNPGMPIAVGVEADGAYDLIYAAGISISPGSRVLCLVLPPKKLGSTRYQARVILH